MTIRARMLMYGKEASNRKQEIDRQHHTIPNQRPKDKHRGNVYNLLFRHGKVRSQNMEKLKCSFPTFCKQTFPQLHKIASYAHSHNADYGETPLTLSVCSRKLIALIFQGFYHLQNHIFTSIVYFHFVTFSFCINLCFCIFFIFFLNP